MSAPWRKNRTGREGRGGVRSTGAAAKRRGRSARRRQRARGGEEETHRHVVPHIDRRAYGLHDDVVQRRFRAEIDSPGEVQCGVGGQETCGDLLLDMPTEAAAEEKGAQDDRARDEEEHEKRREEGQATKGFSSASGESAFGINIGTHRYRVDEGGEKLPPPPLLPPSLVAAGDSEEVAVGGSEDELLPDMVGEGHGPRGGERNEEVVEGSV